MPSLSLAYPSEFLREHGYTPTLVDLNHILYEKSDENLQRTWDMAYSSFWWRWDMVRRWLPPHAADLVKQELTRLVKREPMAIGFSVHNLNVMFCIEAVQMLRDMGYQGLMLLGGPGIMLPDPDDGTMQMYGYPSDDLQPAEASECLARLLREVDAFVFREGEITTLELLQRYEEGGRPALEGTAGAMVTRDGELLPLKPRKQITDLDDLPWPTFVEAPVGTYSSDMLPVLFSRGCPRRCNMCFQRSLWPGYRHRSAESVIEELLHHIDKYGITKFHTYDQSTNGSVKFMEAVCDEILKRELDIDLTGNIIVHPRMGKRMLDKMARAGFVDVILGVESGSQSVLDRMGKGFKLEYAERLLANAAEVGIQTNINLMVGFPGETEQEFEQTLAFMERNQDTIYKLTLAGPTVIYPETELARRPADFGILPESIIKFGAIAACLEWRDETGLDGAKRMDRYVRMSRRASELGIHREVDPEVDGVRSVQSNLPALRAALLEGELFEREEAAGQLDDHLSPSLIPTLREVLDDPSQEVRWRARMALALLEPEEVRVRAKEGMASDSPPEHRFAAMTLARLGDDDAFYHVEYMLGAEKFETLDWRMRQELEPMRQQVELEERFEQHGLGSLAYEELDRLFCTVPLPLRLRALGKAQGRGEWDELCSLGIDPEELIGEALESQAGPMLFEAERTLEALSSDLGLRVLERTLKLGAPVEQGRAAVLLARTRPEQIFELAIEWLSSSVPLQQYYATMAVARVGGDMAFEHLESQLRGENYEAADEVIRQELGPMRHQYQDIEVLEQEGLQGSGLEAMERILGEDACPWLRMRALAVVLDPGSPEELEPLAERFDLQELAWQGMASLSWPTRERARAYFKTLDSIVFQRSAVARLGAPDERLRYYAAVELARIGSDLAFEHLESQLSRESYREADEEYQRELRPMRQIYSIIEAVEQGGPEALSIEELDQVMGTKACPWIRLRTITAAAPRPEGLNMLEGMIDIQETLDRGLAHELPAIEHAALRALVALGTPWALQRLSPYLAPKKFRALPPAWQRTLEPARASAAPEPRSQRRTSKPEVTETASN